jgi:hypothetical protein
MMVGQAVMMFMFMRMRLIKAEFGIFPYFNRHGKTCTIIRRGYFSCARFSNTVVIVCIFIYGAELQLTDVRALL